MKYSNGKKKTTGKQLRLLAEREIGGLIGRLPAVVQKKIDSVTIVFESRPGNDLIAEGIERDTLGLFSGASLLDDDQTSALPSEIILFLENIREEALDSGRSFTAELRRTFLHELGHYLGFEEPDMKNRNLD